MRRTRRERFLIGRRKAMRMYKFLEKFFCDIDEASAQKMQGEFRKTRILPKSLREDECNFRKKVLYKKIIYQTGVECNADYNAALNILAAGQAVTACGAGKAQASAMKQEPACGAA